MSEAKKHVADFVAEIDHEELALRLMERAIGLRRPKDLSVSDLLDEAQQDWPAHASGPFPFRDMADIAIRYLGECVEKGVRPS